MGLLVVILYTLLISLFLFIGITSLLQEDYVLSIIIIVVVFFVFKSLLKNKHYKILSERQKEWSKRQKENNKKDKNKYQQDKLYVFEIKSSFKTIKVSDEELKEEVDKRNFKIDSILSIQSGVKYTGIKTIEYNGKKLDITYIEEEDICNSILYSFFNSYLILKDNKDIHKIEEEYEKYNKDYSRFLKIKNRKDFLNIYRDVKHDYRRLSNSTFPMILSKAVNNPELFNINFNQLCMDALLYYKEHWLNILHNYSIKSAFENRKVFLVNDIKNILTYKCIENNENAKNMIKQFSCEIENLVFCKYK